jgi:hypothetical protein
VPEYDDAGKYIMTEDDLEQELLKEEGDDEAELLNNSGNN